MIQALWNGTKRASLFAILVVMLLSCKAQAQLPDPAVAPNVLAEYEAIKLTITQEGIYRLPLADLGWDENTLDSIALTHKGDAIPYWVENNVTGPNIIFYGQSSTSPYTSENVYIIQHDPAQAQRMPQKTMPQPSDLQVDFLISTIRAEENLVYNPKVSSGSPWHWSKIIAPQSQLIQIDLPQAISGPGYLRVALWGVTTAPASPAHHVRLSINSHTIAEAAWDGQTWYTLEATIPAGVLIDGENSIEIQATGETEALIDIIDLDSIEIDYQRSSHLLEPQEIFRVPEQAVQLTGFDGPLTIFELNTPSDISRLESSPDQQDSLYFRGNPGFRYIAVSPEGYLYPDRILPATTSPDLRAVKDLGAEPGVSYLVIGYPELLEPLEPLLEVRTGQGLKVLAVPIEAVYDQFNGGMVEPDAIQLFLQYALENWTLPPKYVLLVGDTSYDFYGYQTPLERNFVPTFMVSTTFGGETGSDVAIAQVDNDLWPDLAIGRVPARTVEQIEIFVAKTLDFEQRYPSAGENRSILAVADGQEPSFRADAEKFIEQFPAAYQTQLIAPEPGVEGANRRISAEIEAGQLLIAYFGHGSINMWGKDSLFTTDDSAILDNMDRLPVILNFTCLTGLFTHPTEQSMAESLLFNPAGGAVAVLAPTSPTLPSDQTFLSNAFVEAMLQEPVPRLGDITLFAWRKVPDFSESAVDVMQTFLLFGDPALQMPNP